jgi:hypothetical protein
MAEYEGLPMALRVRPGADTLFPSIGPPPKLQDANGGEFDLRAVRWAAGQPLEERAPVK